jgi:hypothetical protein
MERFAVAALCERREVVDRSGSAVTDRRYNSSKEMR